MFSAYCVTLYSLLSTWRILHLRGYFLNVHIICLGCSFRSVSSLVCINWEIIPARARTGETVTWKRGLFVGVILGARQILSCSNCVTRIVFWRKTENSKWVWKSGVLKCALGIAFPSISRWDTSEKLRNLITVSQLIVSLWKPSAHQLMKVIFQYYAVAQPHNYSNAFLSRLVSCFRVLHLWYNMCFHNSVWSSKTVAAACFVSSEDAGSSSPTLIKAWQMHRLGF